jgi:hypothetical protein
MAMKIILFLLSSLVTVLGFTYVVQGNQKELGLSGRKESAFIQKSKRGDE